MYLLLALILQSASLAEPVDRPPVVRTDRSRPAHARPRLRYRFDEEAPSAPAPARLRAGAAIDWRALDASLTDAAERELGATPAAARQQMWRGVPVVIVNGQVHGVW